MRTFFSTLFLFFYVKKVGESLTLLLKLRRLNRCTFRLFIKIKVNLPNQQEQYDVAPGKVITSFIKIGKKQLKAYRGVARGFIVLKPTKPLGYLVTKNTYLVTLCNDVHNNIAYITAILNVVHAKNVILK